MKTWYTSFITMFAITQIRSGTIPLGHTGCKINHQIRRQVLLTYPLGTMLTINGNRLCGGTDETIVEYIPFNEDNPDSVESIKTESEPDNHVIDSHAPVFFLTNVQILNLENTRLEESNRTNLPYEEYFLNKTSKPNDEHSNSSCHPDVTNRIDNENLLSTTESVVHQSTPTENNPTTVSNSFSSSNISTATGTQTSTGMEKEWDVSTNNPNDRNDSHVLTISTLKPYNVYLDKSPSTLNNYPNETIHNVTTPSYGTNYSIPGNQHITTSTQTNFENLPDLSTYNPSIVGIVQSTTPKNCSQSTTNQHITTSTQRNFEDLPDLSTHDPSIDSIVHSTTPKNCTQSTTNQHITTLTQRNVEDLPDLSTHDPSIVGIVQSTTPKNYTQSTTNQHMTTSTQRNFEDLPDVSTHDPSIVGIVQSTTPKNYTQSTTNQHMTTSTQRNFEDLPEVSTHDPSIVGIVHSTTPKNCTLSTTNQHMTTSTQRNFEDLPDVSTHDPSIVGIVQSTTPKNYTQSTTNQHMTTSTQRNFEDLPDLSTYGPSIVDIVYSTALKNCTQNTTKLTTTEENLIVQHVKPENKSFNNFIVNHHIHRRLILRVN